MDMNTQTRERANHIDKQAFVDLYEEHNNALYRYGYRLLGAQDMAEDCVSDVFTRFLQVVKNGKEPQGNIRAYLYRMAHNCAVDYFRKKHTDVPIEDTILKDPQPELEDDLQRKQKREKLQKVLLKMPEEQRMVIFLRYFEDWSHEQVAEYLGKTEEATRALQYRALRNLQKNYASNWK
jgi:RNA polymerase sigma-70 factor (ECF subfamily)